jgi:hypothetical protein
VCRGLADQSLNVASFSAGVKIPQELIQPSIDHLKCYKSTWDYLHSSSKDLKSLEINNTFFGAAIKLTQPHGSGIAERDCAPTGFILGQKILSMFNSYGPLGTPGTADLFLYLFVYLDTDNISAFEFNSYSLSIPLYSRLNSFANTRLSAMVNTT